MVSSSIYTLQQSSRFFAAYPLSGKRRAKHSIEIFFSLSLVRHSQLDGETFMLLYIRTVSSTALQIIQRYSRLLYRTVPRPSAPRRRHNLIPLSAPKTPGRPQCNGAPQMTDSMVMLHHIAGRERRSQPWPAPAAREMSCKQINERVVLRMQVSSPWGRGTGGNVGCVWPPTVVPPICGRTYPPFPSY